MSLQVADADAMTAVDVEYQLLLAALASDPRRWLGSEVRIVGPGGAHCMMTTNQREAKRVRVSLRQLALGSTTMPLRELLRNR